MNPTFGSRLDANNGIGPGFDALRLLLSISILCAHSEAVAQGTLGFFEGGGRYVTAILVPAFFAISGFLVIASAVRVDSVSTFLTFRILRIVPALFAEVLITAILLGAAVTALPLKAYFTDPELFQYMLNVIGKPHFTLPGAFADNPMPRLVNSTLWTIRPEIACYILLALVILARAHRNVLFFVALAFILFFISVSFSLAFSEGAGGMNFAAQERLVFYFVVGAVFYHLRHSIPYRWSLFFGCTALASVLLQLPGLEILAAFPIVYSAVFAGLTRIPTFLSSRDDYSYGIYLFALPIQQLVASFSATRTWYFNIAIALPLTVGVAILSWHFIEKPSLALKRTLTIPKFTESVLLSYASIRFGLSMVLAAYGALVVNWANLYGTLGTSLREQTSITLVCIILVGTLVTLAGTIAYRSSPSKA